MSDEMMDAVWVEKYRPQTLEDMVLSSRTRKKLEDQITKGEFPEMLLIGGAGIGKTTLAKVLIKEFKIDEVLEVNASHDNGVDYVRREITSFVQGATLDGSLKVVILGEASGLSKAAQESLKEVMEFSKETTRFILTANHPQKFEESFISRFPTVELKCSFNAFQMRMVEILKAEKVKVKSKQVFVDICKKHYPDFRKTIKELKQATVDGVLLEPEVVNNEITEVLWKMLVKKEAPEEIRKFYISKAHEFGDYSELMQNMAKYAFEKIDVNATRTFLPVINDYLVKAAAVSDQELNFYCLILTLRNMINKKAQS